MSRTVWRVLLSMRGMAGVSSVHNPRENGRALCSTVTSSHTFEEDPIDIQFDNFFMTPQRMVVTTVRYPEIEVEAIQADSYKSYLVFTADGEAWLVDLEYMVAVQTGQTADGWRHTGFKISRRVQNYGYHWSFSEVVTLERGRPIELTSRSPLQDGTRDLIPAFGPAPVISIRLIQLWDGVVLDV